MTMPATAAASPAPGTEPLAAVLEDLHAACADVQFSLVATRDGFTMATMGRIDAADGERVGALTAGLLHQCCNGARELDRREMEQLLLQGRDGTVLLRYAGEKAMLAVVARPDANVGMVLLEAQRAAERIAGAL